MIYYLRQSGSGKEGCGPKMQPIPGIKSPVGELGTLVSYKKKKLWGVLNNRKRDTGNPILNTESKTAAANFSASNGPTWFSSLS